MKKDGAGSYAGWYYCVNDVYDWGSEYPGCAIDYMPYDVYAAEWNSDLKQKELLAENLE